MITFSTLKQRTVTGSDCEASHGPLWRGGSAGAGWCDYCLDWALIVTEMGTG